MPFEVDTIMDVSGGVSMSGLAIYKYHHMLCVEEGRMHEDRQTWGAALLFEA